MYANAETAADSEQRRRDRRKMAKMLIWHRCVISAADHPMRWSTARARKLYGKDLCRDGPDTLGRKI
jgi:hypothetical protein